MAYIRQMKSGSWQAQVCRRGIRRSELFDDRESAEKWAADLEKRIKAEFFGTPHEELIIKMDNKELTSLYVKAKERAKERGLDFPLSRDDVVMIFARSFGRCQVTGIMFNRFRPAGSTKRPWYPSLDRIDSQKPYTVDNCRFVCVAANFAMGEWGEWVLKALASAISFGKYGNIRIGEEVNKYTFPPITTDDLTPRQRARRRQREKLKDPPQTHHNSGQLQ